jgi:Asp-tRNA(Asn)/Glu-tRNA(Gln) amidotransferase A subunit family amidase
VSDAIDLSAREAVAHIRDGAIKAEAYAARLIERQRALASLGAIAWMDEERLLDSARRIDTARSRGQVLGPLGGLPVVVKDNIDTIGFPTSAGTASLKSLNPKAEAPVAATLWRAGALLFGKANMHELAGGGTSSNPAFGFVRNPHDPARTPGGSSGGTAAALAARIVAAGLGSDTAGSVRIPSAFCGTAALRPTIAAACKLYSDEGVVPLAADLDTVGPMARTVADVALLHEAITGQSAPATRLKGVRIGLPRGHHWDALDDDVREIAEAATARLRDAGAILVDVEFSEFAAAALPVFESLLVNGFKNDLAIYFGRHAPQFDAAKLIDRIESRDTRRLFDMARDSGFSPQAVAAARGALRGKIQAQYEEILGTKGLDAIAYPTEPLTAPLIPAGGDQFEDEVVVGGMRVNKVGVLIRNTGMTCAIGAPGVSLPAGLTRSGLPVGLELDGRIGADGALLGLAVAAEQAIGQLPPPTTEAILRGLQKVGGERQPTIVEPLQGNVARKEERH